MFCVCLPWRDDLITIDILLGQGDFYQYTRLYFISRYKTLISIKHDVQTTNNCKLLHVISS
jgi:hypothetical protein